MLCLGFALLLFGSHAYRVKYNPVYRVKSMHEKIDMSYCLHTAWLLLPLSPHYVSKHLVYPSPLLLLWLVPERVGFNIVLTCMSLNGVLGVLVSCTYALTYIGSMFGYDVIHDKELRDLWYYSQVPRGPKGHYAYGFESSSLL